MSSRSFPLRDPLPPLPTGLSDLDRLTEGGRPGHLWVVSGPPRVEASLMAVGIARAVARHAGQPVRWISTHDDPAAVQERVLLAEGGWLAAAEPHRLLNDEQAMRLAWVKADVATLPLSYSRVVPDEVLSSAGNALADQPLGLLVVDQVSISHIHDVVRELWLLAQAHKVWVVVVVDDEGHGWSAVRAASMKVRDALVWIERPDLDDPEGEFAGEARLAVDSRGRRLARDVVAFQERYARFINPWRTPFYGGRDPN